MDSRALRMLLAACVVLALIPFMPWIAAVVFESVDDRWLDSLGGLSISVPIALGIAALGFASHGLGLQRELMADLEMGLEVLMDPEPLMAARANGFATGGSSAGPGPVTTGGQPGTVATVAAPSVEVAAPAPAAEAPKGGRPSVGKTVKAKVKQGGKNKAGFMVRSRLDNAISRWTPGV